jgi:outer membrane protein TolC
MLGAAAGVDVPGTSAQASDPPARTDAPALLPLPSPRSINGQSRATDVAATGELPAGPIAPSPFRPDVQVLAIDLPTALRVANAANPTIGLARARTDEAYARLREARALWLPNLEAGPTYNRHDGIIQNSAGLVFPTSKWNFFAGGGAVASVNTSDALYAPLIARRLVEAQAAAAQSVTDDVQLGVALAYLDLLRVYGALAVNAETLANASEILRLAEAAERNGLGRTPADANRARTEVDVRRQERMRLEGDVGVQSARVTQLLLLDPTLHLKPAEPAVVPVTLVPPDLPLSEMVATGMMNRPELAESRSLVAASLARWRQSRIAPLLPRLEVSYLAGDFGGGQNDNTQRFGGRGDGTAQAVWTLHNFGAGDVARAQAARAQYTQSNYHVMEIQARVGADVSAAANILYSRQRSLADAQNGVQQAEEMWRRLLKWTVEVGFRAQQYEAVELLLAEQALNQARLEYLNNVIEYNQAQFRLYWAMGQPPQAALASATAISVQLPVLPAGPPSPRGAVQR